MKRIKGINIYTLVLLFKIVGIRFHIWYNINIFIFYLQVTGILGTSFFADMAIKIVGAIESGKGIAIYTGWAFPPVEVAIE